MLKKFLFLSLITVVTSWGSIGHKAVATIAQTLLYPNVEHFINRTVGDIASVANWADIVRNNYKWSEPLHYINIEDFNNTNCEYIRKRDCYNKNKEYLMCVDGAIQNYTIRLYKNVGNIEENLKFLIHFHGDIQQPLHCGFSKDRGGNDIHVNFFDIKTNLHALIDSSIIEYNINKNYQNDWLSWLEDIQKQYKTEVSACSFSNGECSQILATKSARLACDYVYKTIVNNKEIKIDYVKKVIPILDSQIVIGGYYLAKNLNEIFRDVTY